jgi:hypothetical protein
MPAPQLVPCVPPDFPPLAAVVGKTACPGAPTAPRTEVGGETASPSDYTALRIEAGGLTVSPGSRTTPVQRLVVRPPGPTQLHRLLNRLRSPPMRCSRL